MNRKLVLLKLLTLMLCLTFVGQALAQTATVGVSVGNVFKYKVTYFWSSTNSSAPLPADWVAANETEYYQANVTEVAGTTISLDTVQHFLNGTNYSRDELIDVGNSLGGSLLVYAANLVAGSYLYPAATSLPWKINATVSRLYGSGYRDTNHIEVTMTNVNYSGVIYDYRYTSLYFDKASGVLVDATFEDVYANYPEQTFGRTINITDSSLWTVAGTPSDGDGNGDGQTGGLPMELIIGVIAVVVVVAVLAAVLLLRKRGKKRKN